MSYKRKPIPKALRQKVYEKCNGHCAYCGCKLEYKDMQVEHIQAVARGGEQLELDNLLPVCRACNYYKDTFKLEKFRGQLEKQLFKSLERSFVYRLAKKYELIKETPHNIQFYFEKEALIDGQKQAQNDE